MPELQPLNKFYLSPTANYLHDATKVLGKFQQVFLKPESHDWHYGLEVTMRGISTQTIEVNGQPMRASLDLVRHKLRIDDQNWTLRENPPALLLQGLQNWLSEKKIAKSITEPDFIAGELMYDHAEANNYSLALWWMERQFSSLKQTLSYGSYSPILLYPHHFDLSLVWFPYEDERQISVGYSVGDENINEAYVYVTQYPETKEFKEAGLVRHAFWQSEGFSGAVLPYEALRKDPDPEKLFSIFVEGLLNR